MGALNQQQPAQSGNPKGATGSATNPKMGGGGGMSPKGNPSPFDMTAPRGAGMSPKGSTNPNPWAARGGSAPAMGPSGPMNPKLGGGAPKGGANNANAAAQPLGSAYNPVNPQTGLRLM